jgi:hypothetical protein
MTYTVTKITGFTGYHIAGSALDEPTQSCFVVDVGKKAIFKISLDIQ